MENKDLNLDLENIFESIIKPGIIIKEKEIVPGFKVKLKTLNPSEIVLAESIIDGKIAPEDVVSKIRAAKILSFAILELNGDAIDREDMKEDEKRSRRIFLYQKLMQIPPYLLQKVYEFYIECVTEQENLYSNPKELSEKIKNS